MQRYRAIIKRPDEKYGHVTNISTSLENLQKLVDGYVETLRLPDGSGRNRSDGSSHWSSWGINA